MPIYEYACDSCGHALETLQKMSDPALTLCPACGKDALKRRVSAAGFQLKGSGWYATDFRNKNGKKKDEPKKEDSKPATETHGGGKGGCGGGSCGCH